MISVVLLFAKYRLRCDDYYPWKWEMNKLVEYWKKKKTTPWFFFLTVGCYCHCSTKLLISCTSNDNIKLSSWLHYHLTPLFSAYKDIYLLCISHTNYSNFILPSFFWLECHRYSVVQTILTAGTFVAITKEKYTYIKEK